MDNNTNTSLKEAALAHCTAFVTGRLDRLAQQTKAISDALVSETKSSAGDKHETGRAMLQLEREKLGAQLAEAEKMQALLHKVPRSTRFTSVGLGALVITNTSAYYIAVSAGEMSYEKQKVYCVSPATPIGKLLLGKQVGDSLSFQSKEIKIMTVI